MILGRPGNGVLHRNADVSTHELCKNTRKASVRLLESDSFEDEDN